MEQLNSVSVGTPLVSAVPASFTPFDVSLEDQDAFPSLVITRTTGAKDDHASTSWPQNATVCQASAQEAVPAPTEEDWVMVPATSATTQTELVRAGAVEVINGQHPRNLFVKKPRRKQTALQSETEEHAMDWSQVGIPSEVKKQLIHGSLNAAHTGLYGKENTPSLKIDLLRAMTNEFSKQPGSAMKRQKSLPRSRSVPRMIHQPTGRR